MRPHPLVLGLLVAASLAQAEGGYTNHAGNVVSGRPVALAAREVTLAVGEAEGQAQRCVYPLAIFPESEQRRIAADFGSPRVPLAVRQALSGARKALERSRARAAKGLCTDAERDAFTAKTVAALRQYLDRQVESGVITPSERAALELPGEERE